MTLILLTLYTKKKKKKKEKKGPLVKPFVVIYLHLHHIFVLTVKYQSVHIRVKYCRHKKESLPTQKESQISSDFIRSFLLFMMLYQEKTLQESSIKINLTSDPDKLNDSKFQSFGKKRQETILPFRCLYFFD